METTRSLFPLESSGWPVPNRSSADSPHRTDSGTSFQGEADRATERAGGRRAVEERQAETHGRRRAERQSGFERHTDKRLSEHETRRASGVRGPETPPDPVEASAVAGIGYPAAPPVDASGVGLRGPGGPETAPAPSGASGASARSIGSAGLPVPSPGGLPAVGLAARGAGAPGPGGPAQQPPNPAGGTAAAAAQDRWTRIDDLDPARRKALWKAKHQAQARLLDRASERADAILRQIKIHLFPGLREVNIDLEPRELGRLQIKLRLSGDRLEAHVRGESPEALDLLERHLPELRSALAEQGLEVSDFQLALGFGSAETPNDRGGGVGQGGRRGPDRGDLPDAPRNVTHPPAVGQRVLGDGIDLYA